MLGLTQSGNTNSRIPIELYALATLLLVLFINILYELVVLLPDIPTQEQLYGAIVKSAFIALAIYLANQGIKWRQSEGST